MLTSKESSMVCGWYGIIREIDGRTEDYCSGNYIMVLIDMVSTWNWKYRYRHFGQKRKNLTGYDPEGKYG